MSRAKHDMVCCDVRIATPVALQLLDLLLVCDLVEAAIWLLATTHNSSEKIRVRLTLKPAS